MISQLTYTAATLFKYAHTKVKVKNRKALKVFARRYVAKQLVQSYALQTENIVVKKTGLKEIQKCVL